jgi:hypothetical protein
MKKNAILIAGIMFAAGAATQAQNSSYDNPATNSHGSETAAEDFSTATQHDPAADSATASGSLSGTVSGNVSGASYDVPNSSNPEAELSVSDSDHDTAYGIESSSDSSSDVSADSSIRGGSLEARGYDQGADDDEVEPYAEPINPGKQAESSVRGGSIYAREREWNDDSEPSSGQREFRRHMKADSSIRGGSLEARGGREAMWDRESSFGRTYQGSSSGSESGSNFDSSSRHHGTATSSSANLECDASLGAAHDSIQSSSTWNPSDDMLRDGLGTDSESEGQVEFKSEYELNNDASIGGAASGESGQGSSTLDDMELDESDDTESDNYHSEIELNSSEQVEQNIAGEYDLDQEGFIDRPANPDSPEPSDIEAAGAAAGSESGSFSSSSSESESSDNSNSFKSEDPALDSYSSPLGSSANEPNFLYRDNPALGVGSLGTGTYGGAAAAQSGHASSMSDEQLEQRVKGMVTRPSSEPGSLMSQQAARNVEVSASGGEIRLTGTVPTERDRQLLEIRAREAAGVNRVSNQLTVNPDADPTVRDLSIGHDLEDTTDQLQD